MRIDWPRNDYSRVPYAVYHDPELYQLEMERVFRGNCWSYLAFEPRCPIPAIFGQPGLATHLWWCRAMTMDSCTHL